MHKLLASRDSVAVTGSLVGTISLLLGWFTFKPTRVSAGTGMGLYEVIGSPAATVVIVSWLMCLVLSLVGKQRLAALVMGILANLLLVSSLLLTELGADRLLQGASLPARVSPGAGFWLALAGCYVIIFCARQTLHDWRILKNLISWTGLVAFAALLFSGWFAHVSIIQEFSGREARFYQELLQHILLFGSSVGTGTVIGILLGVWATRSQRAEKPIFYFANITQTVPSLALFGLLIAPLSALSFSFPVLREIGIRGVGPAPAIFALVIYSLLPIVRNTYVGFRQLDPAVIDAGRGMGMSRFQIFRTIEAPLAAPLVLEGIRTASVQAVGLAAVAALIGAGGLGWFIFQGLGQAAADLILLGALPIIIMALVVDAVMRAVIRVATPRGLSAGGS